MAVRIGNDGKLGTVVSSRRFKHDIKPMDKASEVILALKPVTFRYNSDAKNTPCFGLIAEEVAEVSPDLVIRDKEAKALSVRYEEVNAMLLNEFLKAHKKVERLQATVAAQQKAFQSELADHQKQIKVLAASLQKINARLETSRSAPELTSNER
jgi:endosialidase-like protein